MHSRCSVTRDLLVDVYPAGGVKSSVIHTTHWRPALNSQAAVIFPHEYPSGVLLNRLSLPCYSTSTSWHSTTEIALENSITHIILETRNTILHNCRRWTKWTAARCDLCKPCLMAAIEELASKGCSVLHARTPRQLNTFYLKQKQKNCSWKHLLRF